MAISTLDLARTRRSVCPHCGHHMESPQRTLRIERGLGILASIALVLMLLPLGIMAWKSCTDFLSNRESHSILYRPLEDWTRY